MEVATPVRDVDFVETPNFTFPMRPGVDSTQSSPVLRNSLSLSPPAPSRHGLQRKSASALPTFTFNSADTSGLGVSTERAMLSPPRGHGHRRGASELVGAAAPFNLTPMLATPVRGHAHRRSGAISISELPSPVKAEIQFETPEPDEQINRRVGFSEDVQIIPRPLSTISTDSSGTITVVSIEVAENAMQDIVLRDEKEGQWLKCGVPADDEEPIKRRPSIGPRSWSEPGPQSMPDLETLFQGDPFTVPDDVLGLHLPRLDLAQISNFRPRFDDDALIDLDAAMPKRKPRQLHSSRPQAFRGRAASAPSLARFEQTDKAQSMADVFEEDEDEDCIEIVAAEDDPRACLDHKLHIDRTLDIPLSASASLMTPTTYAASTFSDVRPATCASSMTDKASCLDVPRPSVDVPSLTSTRSTISRKLQRLRPEDREEKRRKRSSIHSLTNFILRSEAQVPSRKENRLSKLMFWKHRRTRTVQ